MDIRKIVAALIAAPLLGQDKINNYEAMLLRHGSEEDREKIRRNHRARVADTLWSAVEASELLCELADATHERRLEVTTAWATEK